VGASRDILSFPARPWRLDPPTDLHAKWLKRRGFEWYFSN